jgi:hypothetical protein
MQSMQGTEKGHFDAMICAAMKAHYAIMNSTVGEALKLVHYGKSDTDGMDAMAEITIVEVLGQHDRNAVIITEEIGSQRKIEIMPMPEPRAFRTILVSDPMDRSAQMELALKNLPKGKILKKVFRDPVFRTNWERNYGAPATITGGCSAISCVRHGIPICAVIVNHVTQQMFVSCGAGNFVIDLPLEMAKIDFDYIVNQGNGTPLIFPCIDGSDMRQFVTFVGKAGYKENLLASNLIAERDLKKTLQYDLPGGPSRILYLSSLYATSGRKPIGFILANGEKLGEWIHWLPFIRFARSGLDMGAPALRISEIWQDRSGSKDGILKAPPPAYSIFRPVSEADPRMIMSNNVLANFDNPSLVRGTLIVAPYDNSWANRSVNQYGYRDIKLFSED